MNYTLKYLHTMILQYFLVYLLYFKSYGKFTKIELLPVRKVSLKYYFGVMNCHLLNNYFAILKIYKK
jgi:hypothetical protein